MLRLKELREQRGLNQEGLAQKLNVSQSTISAYETGERVPDFNAAIKIANFFHVSLDYLAGLSNVKLQIMESDLSPDELEHLHIYRQLGDTDKEKIKAYIDGLQSRD
ncbi:helix-turn-helix transcriptional regulator [Ructibacterium gallinarum]|uniref:Helix-turn-helix transcriptional regulator n=1 Tax=Ructibacterium gallinarum TaxID=2779355 RepID=A0A9D5R7Z2_9FIRM|nr:helix-turn-helix transcriptional regulator [Ructibacterium gallinarum]MBE5039791.1 helix-turn-helix transcriptional regulator [Ructibacterium gallinarum]